MKGKQHVIRSGLIEEKITVTDVAKAFVLAENLEARVLPAMPQADLIGVIGAAIHRNQDIEIIARLRRQGIERRLNELTRLIGGKQCGNFRSSGHWPSYSKKNGLEFNVDRPCFRAPFSHSFRSDL